MNKNWTNWEHVTFVEDWRAGTDCYEILRKENKNTGKTKYKMVFVGRCVHNLAFTINTLK